MIYIKDYLNKLNELKPIKTGLQPSLLEGKKYKAFIFDIYGTLLISASGDVDEATPTADNLNKALHDCNISHIKPQLSECTAKEFIDTAHNFIKEKHEDKRQKGNKYPEVIIEEIFKKTLELFYKKQKLSGNISNDIIRKLVFIFELASNKVWPMPNMKDILLKINNLNIPLGIVSNAQFYTPLIVNHFLNNTYDITEEIQPFNSNLIEYSYKKQKGKPDTSIFENLLNNLKSKFEIEPEDSVYIGNDMLKDIYTAAACGMDTVLFAGDKRSLRLRENDERCKNVNPTHIITDLSQLEGLL